MLGKSDCSEKRSSSKTSAALKKELLRKSNSCDTFKKVTLKNCEEVVFPKIKLSDNIETYTRREIAIDPDKFSLGISYEYLTEWL